MATTFVKEDGVMGLPTKIERFKDGETLYLCIEHGSYRRYLTRTPLHPYTDKGIDRSPELVCKVRVNKNSIRLPEDAVKGLFRWVKGSSQKVSVTKGYTYGMDEVLYLRAFEE